jgi:hypothetical protein
MSRILHDLMHLRWNSFQEDLDLPADTPILTLKKLNVYRNLNYIIRSTPNLSGFRMAYRVIKSWADHQGLLSHRLGLFTHEILTLLLAYIFKLAGSADMAVTSLVNLFFEHYSGLDWASNIIYDLSFYASDDFPRYRRSNAPMVVLTIHPHVVNVSSLVQKDSLQCLVEELKRAREAMEIKDMTLSAFVGDISRGKSAPAMKFLTTYPSFVKFEFQYWGSSKTKFVRTIAFLNKMFPQLLLGVSTPESYFFSC